MMVKTILGEADTSRRSSPRQRESTVRYLQELYAIVVALALQVAITRMFDERQESAPFRPEVLPLLVAFVATLIPFFHGTLRHLDSAYIEQNVRPVRYGALALLADFILLFLQSCFFFALAVHVAHPVIFGWILMFLLLLDAGWAIVTHLFFFRDADSVMDELRVIFVPNATAKQPELAWARNNLIFVGYFFVFLTAIVIAEWVPGNVAISLVVLVLALVRTFADYLSPWEFYFPEHAAEDAGPG